MFSGQNSCKTFSSCSLSSLPRRRSFSSSRNPHQGTRDKALKTHIGRLQSWVLTKPVDSELFHWKNVTWVLLPFNLLNCSFHFHPFLFFSFPFYRKSVECNLTDLSGISLSEVEEGNEPDEFWKAIGGKKYYCSLAHGKYAPRPYPPSLPSSISKSSFSLEPIFI